MKFVTILSLSLLGASWVTQASVLAPKAVTASLSTLSRGKDKRALKKGTNSLEVAAVPQHADRQLQIDIDIDSPECVAEIRTFVINLITDILMQAFPTLPAASVPIIAELFVNSIDIETLAAPFLDFLELDDPTPEQFQALFADFLQVALTDAIPTVPEITAALASSGLNPFQIGVLALELVTFFAEGGFSSFDLTDLDLPALITMSTQQVGQIAFTCLGVGTTSPTGAPTGAPTEDSGGGGEEGCFLGICACFSGQTTVDVLDQGPTRMHALKVGDHVLDGADGTYSEIYSFGHFANHMTTKYLQIATTTDDEHSKPPLEITGDHMLYANSKVVPASQVKVGDSLVLASATGTTTTAQVASIRTVQRRGAYAPFTKSGNLVVNGIVASNYIALPPTMQRHVSFDQQHWMQHAALTPVRAFCSAGSWWWRGGDGCASETHNATTGYTKPVTWGMLILQLLIQHVQNPVLLRGFLYLFALPLLWVFVNMNHLVAAVLGYYVWKKANKKAPVEEPLKA